MKVYVVTDMEGVSGVVRWEQGRVGTPEYQAALPLLIGEINAAVKGAFAGGATRVLVNDGHDGGYNLTYAFRELDPRAVYLTGANRPQMLCGLDESFDALMIVGAHARAGTAHGTLAHTQSSKTVSRYWVNGQLTGEIGQAAIIAGHYGVPAIFCSGGCAATQEAHELLERVETATVKWDQSETCAICLPHERACQTIREVTEQAMKLIGHVKPYVLQPPIDIRLELKASDYADTYQARGLNRIDECTVATTVDSALKIWRF